jgi:hypothetical protein
MSAQGIRAGRAFVEMGTEDSRFIKGLRSAQKRLDSFAANVAKVGVGVGAAGSAIVAPIVAAAFQFQATGDELAKMSQRTGVSAEALSELRHAAGQSDLAFEDLGKAITKSQQLIDSAMSGNQGNIDKLAKLGLTAEQIGDLTPDQQLEVFADRLAAIDDPAARASRAIEIFGEDGRKMLPMLSGGAEGIQALRAEARALGLQMSTEDANAAAELGDSWSRLTKASEMIATRIGGAVAPALMQVVNLITPVVAAISKWIDQNRGLVVTVLSVGAVLMGLGAALVLAGGLAAGLSMSIGGAIAAGSMLMTVVGGLVSVLGFLASPLGIVTTLLVAGVAYWALYTQSGQATLEWFATNFGELKNIAMDTMGGVYNAIKAGDLGLAAEIAMVGVQLAFATAFEAILGLFGTSIADMLRMFNDFVGKIATYTRALVTVTKIGFNEMTGGVFKAQLAQMTAVVDVLSSLGKVGVDTALGNLGASLDVDGLRSRLDALNQTAAAAADAATGTRSAFNFDEILDKLGGSISMGLQQASSIASVGTFSGQQVSMMGFGSDDLQIRQIEKTEETNRLLRAQLAKRQEVGA